MADIQHPWQNGPTELISYALDQLHHKDDFSQRLAFLILDVGVETLFKTFLLLPDKTTGTKISFNERRRAAEGTFHELCEGVVTASGSRLQGIYISHVQFYHDLRNRLYHQGNGITIPTDKAHGYAELAVDLLNRLLEVDLGGKLLEPEKDKESTRRREELEGEEKKKLLKLTKNLARLCKLISENAAIVVEKNYPLLTLPSFKESFHARLYAEEVSGALDNSSVQILESSISSLPGLSELEVLSKYEDIGEFHIDVAQAIVESRPIALGQFEKTGWVYLTREARGFPKEFIIRESTIEFFDEDGWEVYTSGVTIKEIRDEGERLENELNSVIQQLVLWRETNK